MAGPGVLIVRSAVAYLLVMLSCGAVAADSPADSVIVMRGTDVAHPTEGVVVMRPAEGSFLRETTRLAGEADARERRAAEARARDSDRRVAKALESLASAAYAARPRGDEDFDHSHVWVVHSRLPPRSVHKTLPPVAPVPVSSPRAR